MSQSHEAALRGAWLARLAGQVLAEQCDWLTPLATLMASENKMLQLSEAHRLGILIPRTVVSTSLEGIRALGIRDVVVKPLATASYVDDSGNSRVVPAQTVSVNSLGAIDLAAAPFIFQEVVPAIAHLRVVTVRSGAWAAELMAAGLPLDWRFEDGAHDGFIPVNDVTHAPLEEAVALAKSMGLGYSSQDWIRTPSGEFVFLDLNPAGQWLFLPDAVAGPATEAIADHLVGQ